LALAIGRALGQWLGEQTPRPRVLLAADTRVSGPMLSAAVVAGLCSTGAQVLDCGVLPTPGLLLLVRAQEAAGGVVISASHNAPAFNGIKLVGPGGVKLPDDTERALEQLVFAEEDLSPRPTGGEVGSVTYARRADREYLDLLCHYLPPGLNLGCLPVVLDCTWGAAWLVAPEGFRRASAEVTALHAEPRGDQINEGSGSLHPEVVAQAVVDRGAALGVAFDGDADRAMFVDETGVVRDGDFIKYVLASDLHARNMLNPPVVVGTVMSNLGLELALRERGISLVRAAVGDRYVMKEMRRSGAPLGGEQSGHLIFSDLMVGDGLYSALRVAEVLARTGAPLSELCAPVCKVPQMLLNIPVRDRHGWEDSPGLQAELTRWQERLGAEGRILIRPSGTEPLVRVMVEAVDHDLAVSCSETLARIVADEFGYGELLSETG
jgi:phosphoglucosamine mutase